MTSYLQELDAIKADLEARFPGWQVWYVPHSVDRGVTWCARPHPTLNEDSPEHLAQAIGVAWEDSAPSGTIPASPSGVGPQ